MFKDYSRNRLVITIFYVFLLVGLFVLYLIPKPELFLQLYTFHSPFTDILMKGLTLLGNGLVATVVVVLVFFTSLRNGFFVLLSTAVSGLVTQLLKHFVFPGHFRPVKFFADMGISLQTVPGVDVHQYYSFPSGHTTTAFALWFGLSLLVKNIYLKLLLFLLAVGVGYSRIYLGQHFPEDVLAGAVTGGLSAMIFLKYVSSWEKGWLNKSLISVIRK